MNKKLFHAAAIALVASNVINVTFAQEKNPKPNTQVSPTATDKGVTDKVASEKGQSEPVFVRIDRDAKGKALAMQTAIISYTLGDDKWKDRQVDLIGAVHIAHRAYFQDLNKRFRDYDAVLYELVADPNANIPQPQQDGNVRHPVGAIQVGMKDMLGLEFQLDEINYKAKNFVHADMSPTEFAQDMTKRGDGFLSMFSRLMGSGIAAQSAQAGKGQDMKVLAALLSNNRELKMRQAMAEQFENMDAQLAGLNDASGRSTLVTERNVKAFEVRNEQLDAGKKKLAIFYGAGHLVDMDKRLMNDFKATRGKVTWLNAWNLAE